MRCASDRAQMRKRLAVAQFPDDGLVQEVVAELRDGRPFRHLRPVA